jgi:NAD(P)-dependent dehydrogenase (short-subunit alcohol dehydrogenase family)
MQLNGQVVLVTGAGRGLGRAVALRFAREGANLVLAARTKAEIESVAGEVRDLGREALALPTDVTREAEVSSLIDAVVRRFGRLDCLVTAAGVASFSPVRDSKLDAWEEMIAANLRGVYLVCRAAIEPMIREGRGTIINILSVAAARTIPGSAAYTASKQGALGFTRVLAEEVRSHGIRVAALLPGAVDTPLWDAVSHPPDRTKMLSPDDVAEAACFMATRPLHAAVEELVILPAGGIL